MSQHFSAPLRTLPILFSLSIVALACGVCLAPLFHSRSLPGASMSGKTDRRQRSSSQKSAGEQVSERRQITGAEAREYLQQPGEGQSLMQAITTARFGLQKHEQGRFGEAGAGYLGTSHEQNLNAWFAEEGVTVRPTVAELEREPAWHVDMRLKAYGYGNDLAAAPPIISHQVKGNRIEYERSNFGLRNANFEFTKTHTLIPQFAIRNPQFLEWYENRAEGIEQGFTIGSRPERNSAVAVDEPLRLVVSLQGDLRASLREDGRAIELTDAVGKRALSYSKLTALDANGKQLAAHMEAGADGSEIALVVDDRSASYPIVIDPLLATLEKILIAGGASVLAGPQAGAQFGDAVAIDRDLAIVGAWLDDFLAADSGLVYYFSRTGSTWTLLDYSFGSTQAGAKCGYSVAISGDKVVFGCPGANANAGVTMVESLSLHSGVELKPGSGYPHAGDFFGASVAISDGNVVVGSPSLAINGKTNVGTVYFFSLDSSLTLHSQGEIAPAVAVENARYGEALAIDGATILIGAPGTNQVVVVAPPSPRRTLQSGDSASGDQFGQRVAVSGNIAVIAAPANDEKGSDAGAAYVFVHDASGEWTQQQKLTASDGQANDIFSYSAVAVYGNTIVVGARRHDLSSPPNPNDNSGAAYIFTRNVALWTQQIRLTAGGFYRGPGDEFGTSVGISNDTVIVSAPHETATEGTVNAGASYVYRLNCVPPYRSEAQIAGLNPTTVCPGSSVSLSTYNNGSLATTVQWRKNGVLLPPQNRPDRTYVISGANSSDGGVYDAIVSNACGGEISASVTLAIHTFNLNPTSQNFSASGSPGIINVSSTGSCSWVATSNASFITITSGASATAPGTVGFNVAANTGPNQRTGTITIGDKIFTVTQDGAAVLISNVQFSALNYSANEGSYSATITVTRTGDTSGSATVDFATSDQAAQQRTDYTIGAGAITFAPGETSKTFEVLIVDDLYVEGNEALSLSLSNPTGGAVLGSPATSLLTIVDNDSGSATTNPLDNADERFFVRQHFYDFLSRLPDQGGFDFWVGQITQCGANQACIKSKRLDVSNAFFFELEYQQTGAYVVRMYRAAFGNHQPFPNPDSSNQTESNKLPSYAVFAHDRARVVGGSSLAQSQLNLASAFVARAEFMAKYPASQDGPTFVDAITATIRNDTGADLGSQRTALINLFNSGGRAAVVYRLADDSLTTNPINNRSFIDAEYNRAFVATQYFGYLRRDPDIGGFLFWLGQVNNGPLRDATKQHAMVCAFITAAEYQQRFSSIVTHSNAECQ